MASGNSHQRSLICWLVLSCVYLAACGEDRIVQNDTTRTPPDSVPVVAAIASASLGSDHTCALTTASRPYCWGMNLSGELGVGTASDTYRWPTLVIALAVFESISAGATHTCALSVSGAAYCWGSNQFGQLGDGTGVNHSTPVLVAGGLTFTSISASGYDTCGLTASGAGYCWGENGSGELGDGTQQNRLVPTPVAGGFRFAALEAGGTFTCGLTQDGAAYCWGSNGENQLGTGLDSAVAPVLSRVPTPVAGGLAFQSLSLGVDHACGLTRQGAAYCWGRSEFGQIGDGTVLRQGNRLPTTTVSRPTAVVGGHTFTQLDAGDHFTCGVATGGKTYCWGYNNAHQVSTSFDNQSTPVVVTAPASFVRIFAGGTHTCGIAASGTLYCWGSNTFGELGIGDSSDRPAPTAVAIP
jgi:alpha-tubulin suppressor-like RCC1 family protein